MCEASGVRCLRWPTADVPEQDRWLNKLRGERRELVNLILAEVAKLPDDSDKQKLRIAFVKCRYAAELVEWKDRRNKYKGLLYVTSFGTATLGVLSSGLVAVAKSSPSDVLTVVLIVIGVLVAVLTAANQLLRPRDVASEYKSDEFALRVRGWRYLEDLEEDMPPADAYRRFQKDASVILCKEHRTLAAEPS
jgi:hypothetical protein